MSLSNITGGIDILLTRIADTSKKIFASLGSVGTDIGEGGDEIPVGSTDVDNVEWWQHVGFASRPSNPDPGKKAAQAFVVRVGSTDAAIASQDVRSLAIYGNLKPGETCIYAAGADAQAQARILLKADGSINCYTRKGNTVGGAGMLFQMDASAGAIRILNDKGYGLIIDGDGITLQTGGGGAGLKMTSSGNITLAGVGQTQVDGSGIVIGSLAVPGLNSALTGVTGVAGKASLKVLIE
jgi:hypothetical protein